MAKRTRPQALTQSVESDPVFESAAEVFRLMSAAMRLKISSSLCNAEKNVGQLLAEIDTTLPYRPQHLHTLHRAGVVGKRRERVAMLCRSVCTQIAMESEAVKTG